MTITRRVTGRINHPSVIAAACDADDFTRNGKRAQLWVRPDGTVTPLPPRTRLRLVAATLTFEEYTP